MVGVLDLVPSACFSAVGLRCPGCREWPEGCRAAYPLRPGRLPCRVLGCEPGATGGEEKYKPIMDTPEERFSHSIAWSLDTEVDRPPLPYFQWFSDLLFPSFPFNYCKYFPEA